MAQVIKVSSEDLTNKSQQILSIKNSSEALIKKLDNLVLQLSLSWKGDAQEAFVASYNGKRQFFQQFHKKLETISKEMTKTANKMENADSEAASIIASK